MARVVLLHSAYGLRPAIRALADCWRKAGHRVETPDLYQGSVAATLEEALRLRDAVGRGELLRRAQVAVAGAEAGTVLAGLSLGASLAQRVAARDGRFGRLLLLHGVAEVPAALPVPWQVEAHLASGDAWAPREEVEVWRRELEGRGARVELAWHEGGHLFTDSGLPDFDAASAAAVEERALAFLAGG